VEGSNARASGQHEQKQPAVGRRKPEGGDEKAGDGRGQHRKQPGGKPVGEEPVTRLHHRGGKNEGSAQQPCLRQAQAQLLIEQRLERAQGARVKINDEVACGQQNKNF